MKRPRKHHCFRGLSLAHEGQNYISSETAPKGRWVAM